MSINLVNEESLSKIEKGNNILVRVGGGFMHIEEFIDKYTAQEVEKCERKDVLTKFQQK